ncbi:hypothetical protein [Clostridium massiliodielmoense]|uniref:hypothetical protein n=1 Tax=Clostridium massiliodielmoense TaxID=1776385 RepID=UPI000A26CBD7|nr:hypothetical protein [Clostridium massiliodielmoense]
MDNEEINKLNDSIDDLDDNLEKENVDDVSEDITSIGDAINEGIVEPVESASETIDEFTENYEENMSTVKEFSDSCTDSIENFKESVQNINTQNSSRELKGLIKVTEKSKEELGTATKIINSTDSSYKRLGNTVNLVGNNVDQFKLKTKESIKFINEFSNASLNCSDKVQLLGKSFNNYGSYANVLINPLKNVSYLMDNISVKASNARAQVLSLVDAFKSLDGKKINVTFNKKQYVSIKKDILLNEHKNKIISKNTSSNNQQSESDGKPESKDDDVDIQKYIDSAKALSPRKVRKHFRTLKDDLKDPSKDFKSAFRGTDDDGNKMSIGQRSQKLRSGLHGAGSALTTGVSTPLYKGFKSVINTGLKNEEKIAKSKGKNAPPGKGTAAVNQIKGKLKNLDNSINKLKLSIYNAILPVLLKVLPLILRFINFLTKLVDKFNKLPTPIKNFIANIALVAMVIGPVLNVLANLIGIVRKVVKVFGFLKKAVSIFKMLPALMSPPVLIAIAIIAGLGLIIYEVVKHWDTIKKYASIVWGGIKDIVQKAVGGTVKFLRTAFIDLPKHLFNIGKDIINGLVNGISSMVGKVKETVGNVGHKVASTFKGVLGINSPSRVFIGFGENIAEGLVDGLDAQDAVIGNKVKGISNKIKSIGNAKPKLSDIALSGTIGSNSMGMNSVNNTNNSNQVTFNPNIQMYITLSDTKKNGIKEITGELEAMTMSAMKNTMTNLFMKDAIRSY